jgi:hypothetical protein
MRHLTTKSMNRIKKNIVFLVFLISLTTLLSSCTVLNPILFQPTSSIVLDDKVWGNECKDGLKQSYNLLDITLRKGQRRCEITNHDWVSLDSNFHISFNIKAKEIRALDPKWHTIMQIHSFPDLAIGEVWRCPILSLEVIRGRLRAYSRWDRNEVSVTKASTCANSGNSIQSKVLFTNYPLQANQNYQITVSGFLSTTTDGWLTIYIDKELVATSFGPNAFNDKRGPYLKLGVYKPTSWTHGPISYKYSNIIRYDDKHENP